jgi:hypothetical protein
LTSIPGSPGTANSDHIRGAGATAKRQCKPSLTPSHSPGRNHWPHDVGQTQPFRHQTGQLSDQVSASTHNFRLNLIGIKATPPLQCQFNPCRVDSAIPPELKPRSVLPAGLLFAWLPYALGL